MQQHTGAGRRISELQGRLIEIIYSKEQRAKVKKHKQSFRNLGDTVKHTNIHIVGVPQEDEIGQKIYFKK